MSQLFIDRFPVTLVWAGVCALLATSATGEEKEIRFNRDIRPILSENCFYCHGSDANNRKADLRLDTFSGATGDLGGYTAITPGDPENSELYLRMIAHDDEDALMPPPDSNRSVTDGEIKRVRRWIESGARYDSHWAFQPVKETIEVAETNDTWGNGAIDAFVVKKLQARGLQPKPPTSDENWLRRVHLDMTGLPPGASERQWFESELKQGGRPTARAAAIDRALASPHYGERMAIDWLDVARYADTHGFNNDCGRTMWRWRDWVIEAFNRNLPYDQFITHQLAGDLLPGATLDQQIATGFGRNHVINSEGGIIDEEYRVEYVADRVRTLGMAWLGLTLECARCHDHKYDPITQRDYFQLFAFFNNIEEIGEAGRAANTAPIVASPTRDQLKNDARLADQIQQLKQQAEALVKDPDLASLPVPDPPRLPEVSKARGSGFVWVPDRSGATPLTAFEQFPDSAFSGSENDTIRCGKNIAPLSLKPELFAAGAGRSMTLSLWVKPEQDLTGEQPLISSGAFGQVLESPGHGRGIDLRLVDGEVEFRFIVMYPGTCMAVRTEAARLSKGKWQHIAAVYEAPDEQPKTNIRAHANRMSLYIDGIEVSTRVIHDDLHSVGPTQWAQHPWLIGRDHRKGEPMQFTGEIDDLLVVPSALHHKDIFATFAHRALPLALSGKGEEHWVIDLAGRLGAASQPAFEKLDGKRAQLNLNRRFYPTTMVMAERKGPVRDTFVLNRGAYDAPTDKVTPEVPGVLLASWPEGAPKNRLGLARWLTQRDQPLTARVVVNRVWQHLFGTGLVKTSEDFGFQAEWPSHPALLDYLAARFMDSGWDLKALYRDILLSETYRQSSSASSHEYATDPDNRLLARGPRHRLPAEVIRDQALATSGLLSPAIGGPSVFPYQPEGIYKGIVVGQNYTSTTWTPSKGENLYRRSLYTFWKRTVPHPAMLNFDAPDREFCSVRRPVTNTPLQALNLMNDVTYLEAANHLARESISAEPNDSRRINWLFQRIVGRAADPQEQEVLARTLAKIRSGFANNPRANAEAFGKIGASLQDAPAVAGAAELAALASLILNLDETISKH